MKEKRNEIKEKRNEKAIIARVPGDLWEFVMTTAIKERTTMTDIVESLLNKWKKSKENRLTNKDGKIK
jgi:hypothetical protein